MSKRMNPSDIFETLDVFLVLQQAHLAKIRSNEINDMRSMNRQRNDAFADLKKKLADLKDHMGDLTRDSAEAVYDALDQKLAQIAELDARLKSELVTQKEKLKTSLKRMVRGKHALCGYKSGTGIQQNTKPNVFSFNR